MKSVVSIRQQGDKFLVYFMEQRIMIYMNEQGAEVIDKFLNKGITVSDIAKEMNVPYTQAVKDVREFLSDVYRRLSTTNINEAEQDMLDTPIGAEIEITTACNLRCKHCFQGEYPEKYMEYQQFKSIVDILETNNVYEIHLVGGEVFKHKDIVRMLYYLNSKNFAVTIVTNAVAIDEKMLAVLKSMERLYVLVSLDGTKELHDLIRGKGQYDKIVPKIVKMKNQGIKVEILCTINALNVDYVEEIANLSIQLGVPVNFNLFKPFNARQEYLTVDPKKFFDAVERLLYIRRSKKLRIGVSDASIASYMLGLPPKNECTATMAGLVITTSGKMLTCPYLLEAGYYTENDLPEFNSNFIEEWKKGKVFSEFRNNGQMGCQARSLIFSGDVTKGDPYDLNSYIAYKEGRA